jgi:hypothetical protein
MTDTNHDAEAPVLISLGLSAQERDLLIKEAAGPLGIAEDLGAMAREGNKWTLSFILEDWEELAGFLTVLPRRVSEPARRRRIDALIDRIEDLVDANLDKPGDDLYDGEPDE